MSAENLALRGRGVHARQASANGSPRAKPRLEEVAVERRLFVTPGFGQLRRHIGRSERQQPGRKSFSIDRFLSLGPTDSWITFRLI